MVTADEQAAVDRLNERLAQWRNVGQAEFAEMVGVTEAELLELIPQGVPYHAHPTSGYGEYRFHVSSAARVRLIIECIKGAGHDWQFDSYYDMSRHLPKMVCSHCGKDDYLKHPLPGDEPKPAQPVDTSGPATTPQLDYLRKLNAWYARDITKSAASALIERAKLNRKIVSPTLYAVIPIRAVCEACGAERHITEMAAGSGGYDWDNPDVDFQGSVGLLSYVCADDLDCWTSRVNAAKLRQMEAEAAEAARYDDNSPGVIGGGKR